MSAHLPEIDVFCDWIIPEGLIHCELGEFYRDHPVMARVIATPIAFLCGAAKVLLFPVICAVGVIVLPICALYKAFKGDKESEGAYLGAWSFCVIGAVGSVVLLFAITYHLNLTVSALLFIGFISVSIVIHVYKFVKEPEKKALLV